MPYIHSTTRGAAFGWFAAYRRFLLSRDESMLLKLAPLALIGILPPELLTNLIPGIGLFDDAGYLMLSGIVLTRTFLRVRRYHQ